MDKKLSRNLVPLVLVAMALTFASLLTLSAATETLTVKGELLRVNTDAQTFVVKTDEGTEMEFQYDSETEIVGADTGVAGLATQSGSQVTVHFQAADDGGHLAVRIEIQMI